MGWEIGGGMGHSARLMSIARGLAERGHHPILAVKNLVEPAAVLRGGPFAVVQAPYWHPRLWTGPGPFLAASYADILAVHGYADADDLSATVEAWQSLIDLARPELVVCDFSPTLCLAAYGSLPVVQASNGFGMPPVDQATFPPLTAEGQPVVPQEQLAGVVREVQQRRGRKAPERLTSFLATAGRFITTWPELDPYRSTRREPLLGPLQQTPLRPKRPQNWRFFAYLASDYPAVAQILTTLAAARMEGEVYLRGPVTGWASRLRASGLVVHDRPPPLGEVLGRVSLIVHHASLGAAEAALAAGCPQLLFPRHLEHKLTADALQALGVGKRLSGTIGLAEIVESAQRLCDGEYAERARLVAEGLPRRGAADPLRQIIDRCLEAMAGRVREP
jgi:hypothetical protein